MKNSKLFMLGIFIIPIAFIFISFKPSDSNELPLPNGYNTLFAGSGECLLCHNSMVDGEGNNIGILNYWKSTMMANSSKDPFWRAKVSHELIANPHLEEEIENTCTRCHAPQGSFNAFHNGQTHYTMAEMYTDPIANDGVSCTACHQILEESHGNFSGQIEFGTNHQIYGPYSDIFPNPMVEHTGYTPVFSTHIKDSELCANCHTLMTPTVNLEGELTGSYFPEQAIFHEWKNSFAYQTEVSCQDCHIPEINESIVISTMPGWLDGQSPFGKHELVGGNVLMLKILQNNIEALGLTASEQDFDATIERTLIKLQEESIILDIEVTERTEDSLFVDLGIKNKAGHKIPTGFPSRQIFVQLIVKNEYDENLFISGAFDENGQIIHEAEPFEPHHNIIKSEEQTQIYQSVMADVEGNVTTTLLYADHSLKDNRLVPEGFSFNHPSYDTIAIHGNVENDINFNEGQLGKDIVSYHVPLNAYSGLLNIEAKVFYQTVNSRWLEDMFSETSAEIDAFENMYNDADLNPILMKSISTVSQATFVETPLNKHFSIYPNPAKDHIQISKPEQINEIRIFNYRGQTCQQFQRNDMNKQLSLYLESGVYIVQITDLEGKISAEKLVVY